jgi:glycosyl transferase family 25
MKVYVISLDRAVERRAHMSGLLTNLGIEATFIPAVDGQKLTAEDRRRYASGKARRVYGCEMSDNEIACYLSHLKAYEALIASGEEAALVLEDDISCDERLSNVLNSLNVSVPTEWSVLRLQSTKTSVAQPATRGAYGDPIEDVAGHTICRLTTNVLGGCGYVIRRDAAVTMLTRSRRIYMPIDQTMDRYWENGIAPYVLRPLPVWHEGVLPSEIGKRGRAVAESPGALDLLARRAQRVVDSLNKRLFWLTYSSGRRQLSTAQITVGRIAAICAGLVAVLMILSLPAPR